MNLLTGYQRMKAVCCKCGEYDVEREVPQSRCPFCHIDLGPMCFGCWDDHIHLRHPIRYTAPEDHPMARTPRKDNEQELPKIALVRWWEM